MSEIMLLIFNLLGDLFSEKGLRATNDEWKARLKTLSVAKDKNSWVTWISLWVCIVHNEGSPPEPLVLGFG